MKYLALGNGKINRIGLLIISCCLHVVCFATAVDGVVQVKTIGYHVPAILGEDDNPLMRIEIVISGSKAVTLNQLAFNLSNRLSHAGIAAMKINYKGDDFAGDEPDSIVPTTFGAGAVDGQSVVVSGSLKLLPGRHCFDVVVGLTDDADLGSLFICHLTRVQVDGKLLRLPDVATSPAYLRPAAVVRRHMQDGVHTSRIPGLATTQNGTLLAIFDARYDSRRDLQGDMDIGLHRSTDGGQTWEPLRIAMDMGEWGGLPQKFNGVSDACILVDRNSDAIYIAGLWMHGVINDAGEWVEHLTDTSTVWNHQWRTKGSQPGFGVKQTSQFLVVKSTDDGKTWSDPVNLTAQCKREEWWLWAPAPGNGITMTDGTLVFPTQGRDAAGKSFSNITYSTDGGKTWATSNQALAVPAGTTECAVVELADGSLMLNMRANRNRGNTGPDNGRAIAVTNDMGKTWQEHPTSFRALPEPTCMASLYKHKYVVNGETERLLLFLNPNSKSVRENMTVKVSFDEGLTWPRENWILLDAGRSSGYSCITAIDNGEIGVLYESSRADLVFQKISVNELID